MASIGLLLFPALFLSASAATRCVTVTGKVECRSDPSKVDSTELSLIDRDSVSPFKIFDNDDKFGTAFADESGRFTVSGCASDVDWLFSLRPNLPEVRLQLFHFCNSDGGKEVDFPEFDDEIKDFGTIVLDDL